MIELIVWSVVVAVIVGLVLTFVGRILKALEVPPAIAVGTYLEQYAWIIGVLAGIVYFLTHGAFRL